MLPIWLVTTLPTWLIIFIVLYALAALYVAIKFREVRKFLAGAFFVSTGILWYLWLTNTSIPIVIPYVGIVSIETPDISGQRAIVHFILFLLCFYFGFISNMNPLYKRLVRSSVLGTLVMLALIFIPARTFRYWQGWVYVAVFIICSGAYTVYLAKHDPALLKRRTEAGISHEKEFTQKVVLALLSAACIILVILPPFDVRFGWPLMPWQVSIVGDALVAFSFYIFYLVSRVNTYAAANVRVEQGQKVISTGVYGFVRSNGQTRSLDRSLHPRATRANITKETSRAPVAACTRVFHFGKVRRGVPQKIPRRSPAPPPRKFISKIFLF